MNHLELSIADDGTLYRDLDGDGVMAPYEDPRRSAEERADDLLERLSLAEKAGLMFQTVIEPGPDGALLETPGVISKSATTDVVLGKQLNHFNVHALASPAAAARWSNRLQKLAERSPHGIPVTISTDPRHAFTDNSGVAFSAGPFSQWPEALGLAAIDDTSTIEEFARIAREEYLAVGIRSALHPQIDLATEPRWGRQLQTFGAAAERVADYTEAYLRGFQGDTLGSRSVGCIAKHFPGGGPQLDGEDAHFPYGREQVYPADQFDRHLIPFRRAIQHGAAGMMPYYGMPVGLALDGEPVEAVGFGYNRRILQGLLREELGYEGVIVTDWELVNDNHVGDQVLPARAWGVEHLSVRDRMLAILDAGADQFGGEECVELLISLVEEGAVDMERIDASARRLLLVKFALGLFDDPYVDEEQATRIVGSPESRAAGFRAQARSVTVLENDRLDGAAVLPLRSDLRLYVEGIDRDVAAGFGTIVDAPEEADLAIVRVGAPFEPRDDLFLERYFHQGSLEFRPGQISRLEGLARVVPVVIDVALDRAAVLAPITRIATALTVTFGVSDEALLSAMSGAIPAEGRLPIAVPTSMDAVRRTAADGGLTLEDSLYPIGTGLRLSR